MGCFHVFDGGHCTIVFLIAAWCVCVCALYECGVWKGKHRLVRRECGIEA